MHTKEEILESFSKLLDVMSDLREKCPWDRKQTFKSLKNNTIEETYELAQAICEENMQGIKKELGDVLLHVVFYSKIGSETNDFDIKDVCDELVKKLIFRHPHVYGEVVAETSDKVKENWEELKLKEKDGNKRVLSGVPTALPAMIKAARIQEKAASIGFDWEERAQVWDKVREEFSEFEAEVEKNDSDKMEAEFGDLFFALINAARLYKIDPENALERTNAKFIKRFNYLEDKTLKQGKSLHKMSLAEMDKIWNEAKLM
ncbi:MAG: nucleoside triphosphate pyrophosphohydrolase [Prevotellaceae bacterium]|jgi:XTP/dITP diphosphohydrolase|nr:nucleoside triphosphate pyrophosphohydrolase [Prevotellaceae bacterium]